MMGYRKTITIRGGNRVVHVCSDLDIHASLMDENCILVEFCKECEPQIIDFSMEDPDRDLIIEIKKKDEKIDITHSLN